MANNYSGIFGYAKNAINQTPEIRNNPNNQEYIRIIEQNDAQAGQQLAMNILRQHGLTPEQGIAMAQKFFHLPG